ncbi:hypothetical protein G5I_07244 [Acromyrmex echinatior]|uniref:Uncharacterized protein n=1 Tax=Acromyrmex echinatior TaxID=103372 RepID=F4WN94_ACREC|nr:hypothetical protein G5I_07244 [Acromyrmex echinatior]
MARKTSGLSASKQHRYNVPTCFHTPFITLFIREQVSFVTAARALQAWREWDGLTLMRLVAPLLWIDQKDRLRLPDLLWWTGSALPCLRQDFVTGIKGGWARAEGLEIVRLFTGDVRTGKNWSAKKVMERDCLYTRKSEKGIVKCDRKATTAVWEFLYEPTETSGIRGGDGTDKANSGYFAPRRDTLKRRPCLGRDKPLATAAPIEGVKGGGGGWTSVWVSGEQGRAAACCPHQAPLRIFHREFTSLDTTGKLQEWRSNLSLLASVGSLFFSQVPFPERPSSSHTYNGLHKSRKIVKTIAFQPSYCAIIMRKIVTTIHSTCFIAIFHPHLSPHREKVLNAYGREEKYQVKETDTIECKVSNCKKTQGGSYIAAVVINQCCLSGDERTKGEKGCVISQMMVEVSMKEGGRLVSPKSLSLTNSRMSYEQATANSK